MFDILTLRGRPPRVILFLVLSSKLAETVISLKPSISSQLPFISTSVVLEIALRLKFLWK